ncbi:MAG: hypothetical protein ACJAQW_001380 [Paracoccaceae bacterium]|jgi:hypothetical protein
MIKAIAAAALVFWSSAAAVLAEGQNTVVVELYTSQGCSSCPPADALLKRLALRDDVIALALHVDYWDYIGWKDNFAQPAFTKRQKAYARVAGARSIYTPQIIIGGVAHVVGARPMDVADFVMEQKSQARSVDLKASRAGEQISIRASKVAGTGQGDMIVQLVRYIPNAMVEIKTGENAGKTLEYVNVVTQLSVVGTWTGRRDLALDVPVQGNDPAVIIVQKADHSSILAAIKVQ